MKKYQKTARFFFKLFIGGIFTLFFSKLNHIYAVELSLRGNSLFSAFTGKNNMFMFSIRNLELSASGGRGFLFAKGELDIQPVNLSFFTDAFEKKNSEMQDFLTSQVVGREFFRLKEVYVSTRGLPFFRITLGRFYGAVGNANSQKFWTRNFVERPFTVRYFFGQNGFLDDGLEISLFPPLPWTFEIVGQIFDGSTKSWASKGSFDLTYLLAIRNYFGEEDISGGFSLFWAVGKNFASQRLVAKGTQIASDNLSEFFGGDASFSFQPYFLMNVGYILRRFQSPTILDVEAGLYSEFNINPVRFFSVGLRPEIFGIPRLREFEEGGSQNLPQIFELSISATFFAYEIAKIRLQWTGNFSEASLPQNVFYLQAMFELR